MKRYQSGQTLIEIILALSVAVTVITGITFAITSSLKNATFSKNQTLSSFYAQQGMELVRSIRDKSWTYFNDTYDNNGNRAYFLPENSSNLDPSSEAKDSCPPNGRPACTPNISGNFVRWVKIEKNSSDCWTGVPGPGDTKVTVNVKWNDNVCRDNRPFCHTVELVSCFTNVNLVPTP